MGGAGESPGGRGLAAGRGCVGACALGREGGAGAAAGEWPRVPPLREPLPPAGRLPAPSDRRRMTVSDRGTPPAPPSIPRAAPGTPALGFQSRGLHFRFPGTPATSLPGSPSAAGRGFSATLGQATPSHSDVTAGAGSDASGRGRRGSFLAWGHRTWGWRRGRDGGRGRGTDEAVGGASAQCGPTGSEGAGLGKPNLRSEYLGLRPECSL